jgi:protein phosphatase PTC7
MTAEQQHWYDCPYQVGTNSTDTPLNDATSHVVKLLPSDTIILATDGLGDNLWDQEILSEVSGDNESGTPKRRIQDIADTLCKRARTVGEDQWGESPFMVPPIRSFWC